MVIRLAGRNIEEVEQFARKLRSVGFVVKSKTPRQYAKLWKYYEKHYYVGVMFGGYTGKTRIKSVIKRIDFYKKTKRGALTKVSSSVIPSRLKHYMLKEIQDLL